VAVLAEPLVVKDDRSGLVDDPPAAEADAPGEVHVVAVEEEVLAVEAADGHEHLVADEQARTAEPARVARARIEVLRVDERDLAGVHGPDRRIVQRREHGGERGRRRVGVRLEHEEATLVHRGGEPVDPAGRTEVGVEELV